MTHPFPENPLHRKPVTDHATKPQRVEILETAATLTAGDRNRTYGDPLDNLRDVAHLWEAYLGTSVTAHDVAQMMVLYKIARTKSKVHHPDNYIDGAAYMAIAGEISERTKK